MNKNELYTLEYSTIQDSYHIDLLEKTLEINLKASINKKNNDYQIIYIGTEEDCMKFLDDLLKS